MAEGVKSLLWASFIHGLSPFMRALPGWSRPLPKVALPNTIMFGLRISAYDTNVQTLTPDNVLSVPGFSYSQWDVCRLDGAFEKAMISWYKGQTQLAAPFCLFPFLLPGQTQWSTRQHPPGNRGGEWQSRQIAGLYETLSCFTCPGYQSLDLLLWKRTKAHI